MRPVIDFFRQRAAGLSVLIVFIIAWQIGSRLAPVTPLAQTQRNGPKPWSKHTGPMMSSTYDGYTKVPSDRVTEAPARDASRRNAFP